MARAASDATNAAQTVTGSPIAGAKTLSRSPLGADSSRRSSSEGNAPLQSRSLAAQKNVTVLSEFGTLSGGSALSITELKRNKVKDFAGITTINGYRVIRDIGEGSFARVRLCVHEASGEHFAMKVFRKGMLRRQRHFVSAGGGMKVRTALDNVYSELTLFKRLCHPHCIQLYSVIDDDSADGKLCLILAYAEKGVTMEWDAGVCRFFNPLTKSTLPEKTALSYIRDALMGLNYLHGCFVAHRDVKPQNLLVTANDQVKLADFGVAIEMNEDFKVHGTEGTYHFYAPEMCRTGYQGHDGRKADVWAAGVSMWAFLFGCLPFIEEDLMALMDAIGEARYELPTGADALSSQCNSRLLRMLAQEVGDRPLCSALLQDEWFDLPQC